MKESRHYTNDRQAREEAIRRIGVGKTIAIIEVDKGHKNGPELHSITDTGIIIIRNKRTKKMITKLIARPAQIRRYFPKVTDEIEKVIEIAEQHKQQHLNLV